MKSVWLYNDNTDRTVNNGSEDKEHGERCGKYRIGQDRTRHRSRSKCIDGEWT